MSWRTPPVRLDHPPQQVSDGPLSDAPGVDGLRRCGQHPRPAGFRDRVCSPLLLDSWHGRTSAGTLPLTPCYRTTDVSPLPYIRGQAVVLAGLLIASAIFGASLLAILCASGIAAGALLLNRRYQHDVAVAGASVPHHRASLDEVVAADAVAAIAPATLLCIVSLVVGLAPSGDPAATARVAVSFLAIAAAVIYLSSLVDWYVILPRVSGQLGAKPCRDRDPHFPFPHSWKEVTRWWYIHRIVATLAFRFLLAAAIATVLGQFIGAGEEARILAGLILGVFATYFSTLSSAVFQGAQPKILVGETVIVKARPRRQRWPPFSGSPDVSVGHVSS